MFPKQKFNIPGEDFILPTIENCLNGQNRKYLSTPNMILIHEWLAGDSIEPPVVEAKAANAAGMKDLLALGTNEVPAYPNKYHTGWLLLLERHLQATPEIHRVINENIEYVKKFPSETSDKMANRLSDTTTELMIMVGQITAFNVSGMFFDTPFPKRFLMENLDTLSMFFTAIITQRNRIVYSTEETYSNDIPESMFSLIELDMIISHLHKASLERFFPFPDLFAKQYNLLDSNFYREVAMAFSSCTGVGIPVDYVIKPTMVYHWAVQVLNSFAKTIPNYSIIPKPNNVVKLF